jgi:ribosome biogenesis GTPase / thiamine phosphate phosphatase
LLFPEFSEYAPHCKFSTCSHGPEPGCAVRAAVESGELDRERYESYLKLLEELRAASGRP